MLPMSCHCNGKEFAKFKYTQIQGQSCEHAGSMLGNLSINNAPPTHLRCKIYKKFPRQKSQPHTAHSSLGSQIGGYRILPNMSVLLVPASSGGDTTQIQKI